MLTYMLLYIVYKINGVIMITTTIVVINCCFYCMYILVKILQKYKTWYSMVFVTYMVLIYVLYLCL